MAERGAPRGQRQTISGPRAVTEGRTSIRTVTSLPPSGYAKAHRAAEAMGVSVSGYLAMLVANDTVDVNGLPTWAPDTGESLLLAI